MTALVRAELRKLFSTRLWLWLLLGALGFTALACVFTIVGERSPQNPSPPLSTEAGLHNLFATAATGSVFAIVLGAVGMTSEFRHLTATPTFLASPHRGRVVVAKLITYAMVGVGYGLACAGLVLAIALPWLPARGISLSPTGHGIPAVLLAAVAAVAIYAVVGVGVGALVRNQIAAIVGTLIYLFVLEAILATVPKVRDYYRYFPGGAANSLTRAGTGQVTLLEPWQGGLLLLGYGLVFATLGTLLAVRRDVT
ncbi:MAG: ABC transporter permease [Actinobacteria bacterium]|nr:ABC transporter permease [Actinomycetota bacterium]MBI3686620.1 ABC transporter permease [Actinomycetota bacterium]